MHKNRIGILLLLAVLSRIGATDNLQQLVTDALRILQKLEQKENLYIPRVLNKELYNLLIDLCNDELIRFMHKAEQLGNKQIINSTAAVIVDRFDVTNIKTQQYIQEQVAEQTYPFIAKYINFKKKNKNTRACSGTSMSIQEYVDTYGLPIISFGSASILVFDSQDIDSLYGMQNINDNTVFLILLSNNCIAGSDVDPQFPSAPFAGVPNTDSLFLHNNNITALPSDFLSGLSYLVDLTLAGNQLTSLPAGFLYDKDLQWFDVSNNNFSSTSSINLSSMVDLQIMDLSNNPLGSIPATYFQNNTALTEIYVDNTGLLLWPTNLLDNAANLQYLDASDNSLVTFLPASIADGSTVILTGNLIPTLTQLVIVAAYPNVNFVF